MDAKIPPFDPSKYISSPTTSGIQSTFYVRLTTDGLTEKDREAISHIPPTAMSFVDNHCCHLNYLMEVAKKGDLLYFVYDNKQQAMFKLYHEEDKLVTYSYDDGFTQYLQRFNKGKAGEMVFIGSRQVDMETFISKLRHGDTIAFTKINDAIVITCNELEVNAREENGLFCNAFTEVIETTTGLPQGETYSQMFSGTFKLFEEWRTHGLVATELNSPKREPSIFSPKVYEFDKRHLELKRANHPVQSIAGKVKRDQLPPLLSTLLKRVDA